MYSALKARRIRIRGTVQGVGFRPWVWQLAQRHGIRGAVLNDARGVLIEAWGENTAMDAFLMALNKDAPPLARIDSIEQQPLERGAEPPADFSILSSRSGQTRTAVAADAATCQACVDEIFDPDDRRFGYPFTNCTHCGPRLSIVRDIPYDRANTSMALFPLCSRCQAEYDDPGERRFHAQPNACPECGPLIWLEGTEAGRDADRQAWRQVIPKAAQLLRKGHILAIKGIGGFHLACDASNEQVVAKLRGRKKRYAKAFALMARDLEMIQAYAKLDDQSSALLQSAAAPIVILDHRGKRLAPSINPGQNSLGFMLPYSPLHHLLMAELDSPLVLTSGNISDEPQCVTNTEARERLGGIADYLLLHDRDILTRLDDSVLRVAAGRPRMLRRARGYAPEPMQLPPGITEPPKVLAMGAELKSTFCLLGESGAVLSQHLGDLENASTFREYRQMLAQYQKLYDFQPDLIVVDKHPDYLSTQYGRELAQQNGVPLLEVQHHHAHMSACMAEHGLPADTPQVLGLILDGLGYGAEGGIWGGEFLLGTYKDCERIGCFAPVSMPGGVMAMREPWRNAYAHLASAFDWSQLAEQYAELDIIAYLKTKSLANLEKMLEKNLNSPPASSAGRLFDAVAAVLGLCRDQVSFEGQAAIELEALAENTVEISVYPLILQNNTIYWRDLWKAILEDLTQGVDRAVIAANFHHSLATGLARICLELAEEHRVETLVLSGGVFQNRLLLENLTTALEQRLNILIPQWIPANDGGISLGQAIVGAA
ncbi:carbamoyltransferase HypF, partial [Thiolapillus sp.]